MKMVNITVAVSVPDEVNESTLAKKVFDFFAADAGDLFPEIQAVHDWHWSFR